MEQPLRRIFNPPYSISQWNREAFASDKYGRNFLGVPPQSRADYAFLQHILKSLDPQTGRCAILFPHGVLFRQEEKAMRAQLIESDLVEAVIGLGPNLFYNSPMEACILICRTRKEDARKGHVLFINAVDRVERKNAQSYLTDEHIKEIATAYEAGAAVENFARLVPIAEIQQNDDSMSIPLYVRNPNQGVTVEDDDHTLSEAYELWEQVSFHMHHCYTRLDENPCSDVTRKSNYGTHSAAFPSGEGGPRQRWKGSLVRQNKTHVQTSAGATTTVTLGDVATERKETYQPQGGPRYGVLGLDQMESGELSLHDWAKDDPANTFTKMFHAGDVLFGRRRAYLRKAVIAPYDGICSGDITVIRPNAKKILPALLPFVIQNDAFFDYAVGKSAGSLSPRAKWKDIQDYTFTLPPMEEQKQLAAVLWSMVRTQEAYRRLLEKTDELVEARFVDMFGNPATNSKGLKQLPLKDCLNGIENGTSFVCSNDARTGNHPAVLKLSAATYGIYKPEENKAVLHEDDFITDAEVHDGDLLFTRKNTPELVGISAYVRHTPPKLMLPDIIFRLKTKESCNKIFLWKLLNHYLFRNTIRNLANGSANSMVNISKERLGSMPIILPPIDQQKDFERFVDQAAASKSALQQSIDALQKTYRKLVSERLG